jgi:hypothetical protein
MKFRRKARTVRRSGFARKAKARRSGKASVSPMKVILAGGLYGAGRSYLVNLAAPITGMLGVAGGFADELVLGAAGYYLAKKGKGMLKNVGLAMLYTESFSAGSQLIGGSMSGGSNGGAF